MPQSHLYIRNATRGFGLDTKHLRAIDSGIAQRNSVKKKRASRSPWVRDAEIQQLNREHRAKDRPTDVLSFPLDGEHESLAGIERLLGDIVISLDTAKIQAEAYDAPLMREVERLMIHGILHLVGHDHEEPDERVVMEAEERRLAKAIGMPWPYLHGEG